MSNIETILIKKDVISPTGAIIIPKGKLLKLNTSTINKLKSHGVYYEVLDLLNNSSQNKQNINDLSHHTLIKNYMLSDNSNNGSLQMLRHNDSNKYLIALKIMNDFLFESKNEEWYLYLNTLFNGYNWYYSHSIDVAVISALIGINLGCNKEQLHTLILGSLLHDIGIILLPKNILFRDKNLLTPEEKDIFDKHTSLGYAMVKNLSIPEACKRIILDHHKLLDGTGYPDSELSLESKIVLVSDFFDCETTIKKTPEETITYLINNSNIFPIEIVSILKNLFKL